MQRGRLPSTLEIEYRVYYQAGLIFLNSCCLCIYKDQTQWSVERIFLSDVHVQRLLTHTGLKICSFLNCLKLDRAMHKLGLENKLMMVSKISSRLVLEAATNLHMISCLHYPIGVGCFWLGSLIVIFQEQTAPPTVVTIQKRGCWICWWTSAYIIAMISDRARGIMPFLQ